MTPPHGSGLRPLPHFIKTGKGERNAMKATVKRRCLALLLALTLMVSVMPAAYAADGDPSGSGTEADSGDTTTDTDDSKVVLITVPETYALDPGDSSAPIEPQLQNANTEGTVSNKTRLTWSSDDTSIATIDYDASSDGYTAVIHAEKPGKTTIRVAVRGDEKRTEKTIAVTVNGIALKDSRKTVSVLENDSIVLSLKDEDFAYFGTAALDGAILTCSSDKQNVARVTCNKDEWTISGISEGRATISVAMTSAQGGAVLGNTVTITVEVQTNEAETIVPDGLYSPVKPLCLASVESDIVAQCKEMIQDTGNALSYITSLTVPTDQGTLYLGYKSADDTGSGVGSTLSYYVNTAARGPYIKDVYFVPNSNFSGSYADITFTGVSEGDRTFKGKIRVRIEEASTDVSLTTMENTPLKLKASVFSTAFQQMAGVPLSYLVFTLPSASQGVLYRDYVDERNYGSKVAANEHCTPSAIDEITFVPADDFVGPVTLLYAGYTASGRRYNGVLTIDVTQGVDDSIVYNDNGDGHITFYESDFNDYSERVTGDRLDYVIFDLPAATQGKLYYDWRGSKRASQVAEGERFDYRSSHSASKVTFVPAEGFEGVTHLTFSGAGENGKTFTGTLELHFQTSSAGEIEYACPPGSSVKIQTSDFNSLSLSLTGQRLHYITFQTLPDHTLGALYHGRTSADVLGTRVSRDTKYYNSATPYIMNLSFWATDDFHGSVEIPFTGCSVSGQSFSGLLVISSGKAPSKEGYSISYRGSSNGQIQFRGSDFDTACRTAANSALSYVRFSLPGSSQGSLRFQHKLSGEPVAVSASDSFYLNGEASIDQVSFVPSYTFAGVVEIPFTGWSISGVQFKGSVKITVDAAVTNTTVWYRTTGSPVRFSAYDFTGADNGGQLVSLRFTTLPPSDAGKLYYQYLNPTHYSWLAGSSTSYLLTGEPLVSNLTFIPKAGFKGVVSIPYTATTTEGRQYDGQVQIAVEPSTDSQYFRDLTGYSMETSAAVDYLYSQGVVNGVSGNQYAPGRDIRRGDFCLMLYRAFQFRSDGALYVFRDVPSSAYYAQAVNVLRSCGIVNGTGSNEFRPDDSISRQDAALMVQRAMRVAGMPAEDGPVEAALAAYSDQDQVSGYAQGAVAYLLRAGLMPVGQGYLDPKEPLTRGDMAVLLHRAMTQ